MDALDEAQNLVRGKYNVFKKDYPFDQTSFVYKKTNERLQDIPDILENKKRVLCVIGSGDQLLNILLSKPDKVDAFDISVFPRYFLELKIAAIKTLSREEYISFFIDDIDHRKEDYYDDLFFERIAPVLGEEEYYKLREILKKTKIKYITSDILELDIDEEYDLIENE